MKRIKITVVCLVCLSWTLTAYAQQIIVRGLITSEDREPLISVTIAEIDRNNRIVNGTVSNYDGEYVLQVRDKANRLRFNYVGFKAQDQEIGERTLINVTMQEESLELAEAQVTGKAITNTGTMNIPTREISFAMQKVDAKEFEGIQVTSVEDALQGRVSGLDIVSNSGAPGSGMSMRIRGTTSLRSDGSQPLIVVNGVPFETTVASDFDFATAREEQYAELLTVNPDDILEIVVLKDAASTAIWGAQGANGVLQITTKKGARGRPKVQYTYRLTSAFMPDPIPLLNGDEYTMLMKEEYLNPTLNTSQGNIPEYGYVQDGSAFFWNYNNNTDWVKEITRTAWKHDNNLSISGGGERGDYRISFGYLDEEGIVYGQGLRRFTNRTDLGYVLSDRLIFRTELAYTFSDNDRNYDGDILNKALRKMPNVPVYTRDEKGNYTDVYFNIDRGSSNLHADQRDMVNPVGLVNLASYNSKSYRIIPTFRLQYDILDPGKGLLRFKSSVSMDVNSIHTTRFFPKELSGANFDDTSINYAFDGDEESVNIQLDNNLTWQPRLRKGHAFMIYGAVQTSINKGSSQSLGSYWAPSSYIQNVSEGFTSETKSYSSESHGYGMFVSSHYAYLERYIVDFVVRRDVSSRFGKNNRVGYFPGISLKWIASDENFLQDVSWINMLAFRPSWGISGNTPKSSYLHYSKYSTYPHSYIDMPAVYPSGLQISNLRWEKTTQLNMGIDFAFIKNRLVGDINFYHKRTTDLLFQNLPIPASSGFSTQSYENTGVMDNDGWELNMRAPSIVKSGDFSVDISLNLSNYYNTIMELSDKIELSKGEMINNGEYLRNIIIGNPLGSFYGYRFKGVYQYSEYIEGVQENAPVARDAENKVIYDRFGVPKPMWFNYGGSNAYQFQGGDAIYEDINHDGSIDELDVVYLGNANPKVNGGFSFLFRYKRFSVNAFFHFRYGNQIVNESRMRIENMYSNDNQSIAVKWRWRKEGDVTNMPRALYNTGYNWLGSDRYVEDGSFLRFKYLTLNYSIAPNLIKRFGLTDLRFYLTLNNLALWTNYSGVDPEVGYAATASDPFRIGYDTSKTPRSKDGTFGVTIGF